MRAPNGREQFCVYAALIFIEMSRTRGNSRGASGRRPREMKVVLLGDTGVGKSSLVSRFSEDTFRPFSAATVGASFVSKTVEGAEGGPIQFQIWDTAGQEKYHSLAPMYYRGAAAAIITYDISNKASFETLKNWVEELNQKGPGDITLVVAGNKCDLEELREVDSAEATAYAASIKAIFLETSAKTAVNVTEIFVELSRRVPASKLTQRMPPTPLRVSSGVSGNLGVGGGLRRSDARCGAAGGCC